MSEVFDKVKAWAKIGFFTIVAGIVITFLLVNHAAYINPGLDLIFVHYEKPNVLLVLFFVSVSSIFAWWLFKVVYRTARQLRTAGERGRSAQLERDIAEMKAKAAMLQTKPPTTTTTAADVIEP